MNERFNIEWRTTLFGIPTTAQICYSCMQHKYYEIISINIWSLTLYAACFPQEILDKALEEVRVYEEGSKIDHAMDLTEERKINEER